MSKNVNTPKIKSVKSLAEKKLLVKFSNGVEKIYDCNQLLQREMFQPLNNEALI